MLKMNNISKSFGSNQVLKNLCFHCKNSEVVALLGQNGAGKSTLMKILSGALKADAGTIELNQKSYKELTPQTARAAGIAMIYQELALAPELTIEANVMLGLEEHYWGLCKTKHMQSQVKQALTTLGHPDLDPNTTVKDLPIGLKQVVEIARAVISGCKILVLDEPTSSLTPNDTQALFELITRLKDQDVGIIYISHFLEEVFEVSNSIVVLRDGQKTLATETKLTNHKQLIEAMVGRSVTELYPKSNRTAGAKTLELQQLTSKPRPKQVSFSVRSGQIFGIAGLIGSGRTELLESIFGLRTIETGKVKLKGSQYNPNIIDSWHESIGYLSEDRALEGLALSLSIAENILLPNFAQKKCLVRFSKSSAEQITNHWIKRLSIKASGAWQAVGELSGGNQQKVALARLLQQESQLLLLDEPTRGIDAVSKAEVYKLLDQLVASNDDTTSSILITSSYIPELLGICDQIACLYRGKLGPIYNSEEVSEQSLTTETCGGLE